jgi:hypothetical protein
MKTSVAIATFLLGAGRTAAAPASSSLPLECGRLISCLTEITELPVLDNIFDAVDLESVSVTDICNEIILIYGGETGVTAICEASNIIAEMKTGSNYRNLESQQDRQLSQASSCSDAASHVPEYPDTPAYDLLTVVVSPLFFLGGNEKRADTERYSILFIAKEVAKTALAGLQFCDNSVAIAASFGVCAITKGITTVAFAVIEGQTDIIDGHNGNIDSAEIQAAYKNTNAIIEQNCHIDKNVEDFRLEAVGRFDTVDDSIANLQADEDLDSLKLFIEPTKGAFLVLSTERGIESEIDLVIDCYDEADEMYRTQPFTRTKISEGTTLVKLPNKKSSKKSGNGDCNKIRRFKGTAKKVSNGGTYSVRTVITSA